MGRQSRGDRLGCIQSYTQSYTQSYSKYHRQPRVRTVRTASLLGILVSPADGRGIWKQCAERAT